MQVSPTVIRSRRITLASVRTVLQLAAMLLIALVAGSTFGIWRGYNPGAYSAPTFLEVHQGAVGGLNVLLPVMGAGALLLTGMLAVLARRNKVALRTYLSAFVLMAAAGAITRLANQPINAEVVTWTSGTMPPDWAAIRDAWWNWHIMRTLASIGGLVLLILAVFADRCAGADRDGGG